MLELRSRSLVHSPASVNLPLCRAIHVLISQTKDTNGQLQPSTDEGPPSRPVRESHRSGDPLFELLLRRRADLA